MQSGQPFESTCYATYKPEAWLRGCSGPVEYHRQSDMFLCTEHRMQYDSDTRAMQGRAQEKVQHERG